MFAAARAAMDQQRAGGGVAAGAGAGAGAAAGLGAGLGAGAGAGAGAGLPAGLEGLGNDPMLQQLRQVRRFTP